MATSFLVTTDVLSNRAYQFRVRAKNIYGWGSYSAITSIFTAEEPEQVTNIQTIVDGTNVIISWDEPFDNYDPIVEYLIEIR